MDPNMELDKFIKSSQFNKATPWRKIMYCALMHSKYDWDLKSYWLLKVSFKTQRDIENCREG